MRFGVCTDIHGIPAAVEAGYDYLELHFQVIVNMSDGEYEILLNAVRQSGLKAECFNGFFPADIPLVGPQVDFGKISEFTQKGMQRAQQLGGKIVVLGSGTSRRIPEGFSRSKAYAQFQKAITICGDIAQQYGIQIAIEPLNPSETNLIHTVSDGVRLCQDVNHPAVGCLVDFFHFYKNGEALEDITSAGKWIIHTHLARPNNDRQMPKEEDIPICRHWIQVLKAMHYSGRMSLEGVFFPSFPQAITQTMDILKQINN